MAQPNILSFFPLKTASDTPSKPRLVPLSKSGDEPSKKKPKEKAMEKSLTQEIAAVPIEDHPKKEKKNESQKADVVKPPAKRSSRKSSAPKVILPPLPPPSEKFEYARGKFGHPDNPPNAGLKRVPKGAPGCLQGITFCATGTLDSLTKPALQELIESYGGSLTKSTSGKTDILIRGVQDVGQSKQDFANEHHLPIIDEDGLFFILKKSAPELNKEEEADCSLPGDPVPTEPEHQSNPPEPPKRPLTKCEVEIGFDTHHRETDLFAEKYRPQALSDLVGNETQIKEMKRWIESFATETCKAVLISGPPGIGKSTAAALIAKQAGFHVVEFNASDTRSKTAIEAMAKDAFSNHTLYRYNDGSMNVRTAMIFDEVDGMSAGDRGGLQALANLVQKSKIPIFCICNDRENQKLQTISKYTKDIRFNSPNRNEIATRLNYVVTTEKIQMTRQQFFHILDRCRGDIRSALNMLQLWRDGAEGASEKDSPEQSVQKAVEDALRTQTLVESKIDLFFVDYDSAPDFMYQNLPTSAKVSDYAEALNSISYGDVMQNFIRNENSWDLLQSLGVISWALPAAFCPSNKVGMIRIPCQWSKMKAKARNESTLREIASNCSRSCFIPRSSFRDCVADLISAKFTSMVSAGEDEEAVRFLDALEVSKDSAFELKDIVIIEGSQKDLSPQSKAKFTKFYNERHAQSKDEPDKSMKDSRADFFIKSGDFSKKGKRARK